MISDYLQKSMQQYREIIEHADQLDSLLSKGNPEKLLEYTADLKALQHEAEMYDHELLQEMGQETTAWQAHPLFMERMQLLEQIVEMNNLLLPRARGMMSVTAAELTQLKEGRTAVSGYHQRPVRLKKSVRGIG